MYWGSNADFKTINKNIPEDLEPYQTCVIELFLPAWENMF